MDEALTIEARHERQPGRDRRRGDRPRHRGPAAHGGSLHVVCGRPRVRQLFRLTGLDRRLPPARTLDEALDALMAARGTPR